MTLSLMKKLRSSVILCLLILLCSTQVSICQARGIQLHPEGDKSYLTNSKGQSFVAKGVIYYQPNAAHHYFLENLDLEMVPDDLQKFKKIGFNTIGIDVGWGELFADVDPINNYSPTRIYHDRVNKLKQLAKITQEHGFYLYVMPNVQIVPPQIWAKDFPATTDNGGNFHPAFKGYLIRNWLVDESLNAGFVNFLEFMGKTLKPFDNVLAYALPYELMEQQFPWCHEDYLLVEKWRQYLKNKNPDIKYWNKRWKENYKSIQEMPLPYRDRDYWHPYYRDVLEMDPKESHPLMWRDCYDFMMVAIGWEGRYGLSFKQIAGAIRKGDPDALILWKAHDPMRYAWEMGDLDGFNNGTMAADAENILKKIYTYPGIDFIATDGYPNAESDPVKRAAELTFKRNYDRAASIRKISPLPFYCQEFGINHHQWSTYECEKFMVNAIKGYQELGAVGYNLWQSHDYYGGATWGAVQPKFGIFDTDGKPFRMVEAIAPLLGGSVKDKDKVSNVWDKYLDEDRLKYHGYFFHNDVLEHKEEVKKLAEFTNLIFCNVFNLKDISGLSLTRFFLSDISTVDNVFFENASKRLSFLDSLGFTIISEYPSAYMLADGDKARFRKNIKYIKSRVPEMDLIDFFYIADEPDINQGLSIETLEFAIDVMKENFPRAQSTICYALAEPRMLDTKIPKNLDVVMVDPYFLRDYTGNTSVDDFEIFYQSRLATTLSWVNRWNKPFMIIGDAFWSIKDGGKKQPSVETCKWFYQAALLQPNCVGLGWFLYGDLHTDEGLKGVSLNDSSSAELLELHKQIGRKILHDKPSLSGVSWRVEPVKYPEEAVKALAATELAKKAKLPGIYVEGGKLMRKGKPYKAIGVNYFDAFYRVIKDPTDKSYKKGFKVLREDYDIPFIRFMAGGYWHIEWEMYLNDKEKYFKLMDELVAEAEKRNLGLIPSLFWYVACVPDLVGEPMDQLGNPNSKTIEFIKTYTREMVSRYKDSPAIWAWEFGNEHMLAADIPRDDSNLNMGRARIVAEMNTPAKRSERDRFSRTAILTSYNAFADEVRKLDPHRMICTGDATTPQNAFHRYFHKNWDLDNQQQWTRMLMIDNPGSIDCTSIHVYPEHDRSYFPQKVTVEELITLCNKTAKIEGKPLFVGEFGAPETMGDKEAKEYFFKVLKVIEEEQVPLSALWVYDFTPQNKQWNVTADNKREYMLEAIKRANKKFTLPKTHIP